ncbi:MAG TPA: alpha-2-macroglobulin family protein, partial [Blastocatellia bacterium]|nr:alpha-2-macroglobulin family protein [Blastocatellia bacterium]
MSLYEVTPEMWPQFEKQLESRKIPPPPFKPLGRLAFKKTINVDRPEQTVETRIDLSPALKGGLGHAVLVIDSADPKFRGVPERVWIQSTNIGLDAFRDKLELVGWANSLKDGKPLANIELSVLSFAKNASNDANSTLTDAGGIARLSLLDLALTQDPLKISDAILIAKQGSDIAMLPQKIYGNWHKWDVFSENETLRWHVFNDRTMYRPGEEVHIKGWIRNINLAKDGDVEPIKDSFKVITYKLKDDRNIQIATGEMKLNAFGGFDTSFKLPELINFGYAKLELQILGNRENDYGQSHIHNFQVQEFRRPEYETTVQAANNTVVVGDKTDVTVKAAYYAGGALANAEVFWEITSSPTNFTPPGRSDFTFGKWQLRWRVNYGNYDSQHRYFTSRTDRAGKHQLKIDFISINPPRPSTVSAFARVTDVNRQSTTARTEMLVHPAAHYVGLRSSRTFVEQGQPLVVQAIVTDLAGKAIANREIKMRAVLLDWAYQDGQWKEQETEAQEQTIKSASEAATCRFETKLGGQYRITATIVDDQGRPNESEMQMWVAGGKPVPQKQENGTERVELIPDRDMYKDGDTAEILVQAPFYPAEGVMTLRRSGIVQVERFTMNSSSYTLRVPIKDAYVPNLHVQVDLVGATVRDNAEGKPDKTLPTEATFTSGTVELSIPPLKRKLQVAAIPRSNTLKPGDETIVDAEVKDASGKPVSGSEVALVVIDEAILALTNYELSDPINSFYLGRDSEVTDLHSRDRMIWATPAMLQPNSKPILLPLPTPLPRRVLGMNVSSIDAYAKVSGPRAKGGGGDGIAESGGLARMGGIGLMNPTDGIIGNSFAVMNQFRTRSNFNPLATFAASLTTDANGRASVKVKLPDNLTRYRVMAVAAAGKNLFGIGESAITAKLPLMVRPSAPRFLNFGDRFELPVVVQNQTDKPMTVDVAVRTMNVSLTGAAGKRVTVPADDRVEVRFPATTINPGTAQFQIAAVAGEYKDAAEVVLPVWTPATTEAFATYGELDAGAISQPVKAPVGVVTQFGGLEITTSSTQLQSLTDAVLYLSQYPFECAEQVSSRVLAVAALRDVLNAFKADGLPAPEQLQQAVSRDLSKLQSMQNADGGFGFWQRGEKSWPFLSIHAAHAMLRAKEKQFTVSEETLNKSKDYLSRIEKHIPADYSTEARRALIAYALYVRSLMGERDALRARRLVNEAGSNNLSLEAAGWLLAVLSKDANSRLEIAAIRRIIN